MEEDVSIIFFKDGSSLLLSPCVVLVGVVCSDAVLVVLLDMMLVFALYCSVLLYCAWMLFVYWMYFGAPWMHRRATPWCARWIKTNIYGFERVKAGIENNNNYVKYQFFVLKQYVFVNYSCINPSQANALNHKFMNYQYRYRYMNLV